MTHDKRAAYIDARTTAEGAAYLAAARRNIDTRGRAHADYAERFNAYYEARHAAAADYDATHCPTCGAGPDELHDPRRHDPALDERLPADNELDAEAYEQARTQANEEDR